VRARGRSPSLDSDDVFQAGVVGLIHAAQKFDWRRGYTFATYATYWIRQAIQREWSNSAPQVHIPVHFFSYLDQPPRGDAEPTWTAKSEAIGRDGVPNAIAILNGLQSLDHLTAVQREDALRGASRVLGAGVSSDEEDVTFAEADSRIEQRDLVRLLKDGLDPRGFRILMLRFGFDSDDGWTLDEVGRSMGLTRERIRQIEKVALASSRVLLKGFEVQIE
jgi:RNA polymerase primary sigma factor